MNQTATGPFDVKLNPLDPYNKDAGALLGRMSIDKQFHGDLDATSKGEMLTAALNGNGMVWKSGPAATELEQVTLGAAQPRGPKPEARRKPQGRNRHESSPTVPHPPWKTIPDAGSTGDLEPLP